ncbi:sigma 54-interacting transcriptional regulator [Hymenobacter lapidiphilus]|uniref:Sigma 54-interacting transcriptional regulator n=1 Tax=Hymenobacter lapidiphilus TaxID=2608003 RepID=A0A7Y7U5Z4_9BACT|nr:sigma 54-interacting transcriptional regulator [Hymenobacter lapidiphilus]NVO32266.1 sigma 54-interacting transcriptional regulator [Hymenobacter lapidiphilus]
MHSKMEVNPANKQSAASLELLLDLSTTIATLRDRTALLRSLFEKLQPVFGFHDVGLFVLTPDGRFIADWAARDVAISPSFDNEEYHKLSWQRLAYPGPGLAVLVDRFKQAGQPVVVPYDDAYVALFENELVRQECERVITASGYRELMGTLLRAGGQVLGYVCFNSLTAGHFQAAQFDLFQGVADQLAASVANILAHEELQQREQEKTTLLSISQAIATARNSVELLTVIREKAQRLLPFYDTGVLLVDAQGQFHYDLAVNLPDWDPSASNNALHAAGLHRVPHAGSYVEYVMGLLAQDGGPLIEDYTRRYDEFDYPFFPILRELGFKEGIVTELRSGGKVLGTLWLNALAHGTFSPAQFGVFQNLADQVASAVANILAQEEILAREQEKAALLNITEALSRSSNRREVLQVVYNHLRQLLPFDGSGLFIVHEDEDFHQLLIHSDEMAGDPTWPIGTAAALSYRGSAAEWMAQGVGVSPLRDLMARFPNHPHYPDLQAAGIQEMMHGPLSSNGHIIGLFCLNARRVGTYSSEHLRLFRHVADQLAVAVANILAHEDIVAREREKTLQIEANHALSVNADWATRLGRLSLVLQAAVPHDYLVFCIGDPQFPAVEHMYRFERIGHEEYRCLDAAAFCRISGLSLAEHEALCQAARMRQETPELLQGAEFTAFCQRHKLAAVAARAFGLHSQLRLPVPLSRGGQCVIAAYSRQAAAYRPEHLSLLVRLAPTLGLMLEKLLAYEEIQSLNEQLQQEKAYLKEELQTTYNFGEIIGSGPALQQAFRRIQRVAPTDATVLLEGETGTGKELFARALHEASPRRAKVLVKVNCAALPAQLIESELFGHERGAFTGAHERRIGKFELAQGSTIFLDEIGELPLELQAKLLRVLQEKEFERLGGSKVFRADVRVVAATNRDLQREVAEGRFRADLFFRLNVVPVRLPSLRERPEDIPLLAQHFLRKYAARFGKALHGIAPAALQQMQHYHWPGNVRELEHLIEQSLILSESRLLELAQPLAPPTSNSVAFQGEWPVRTWQDAERDNILAALRLTEGRIRGPRGAARLLDIHPNTLDTRMQKLGISKAFIQQR